MVTQLPLGMQIQTCWQSASDGRICAEVLKVQPGSVADVAGICEGYVLVKVNDQPAVGETWLEVFQNMKLPFSLTFLAEAPVQLGPENSEFVSGPYDVTPSDQYEAKLAKRIYSAAEKKRRAALRQRARANVSRSPVRNRDLPLPPLTFNGVHLVDSQSLVLWTSWSCQNILPHFHAVVAFDMHNVLDTMSQEQAGKMSGLKTQRNALAVLSRGPVRWKESFNIKLAADIYLYTEVIQHDGPVRVYQFNGMPSNVICIDGDKGDVAALLGLPLLLFDDKERNLDVVLKKGVAGCEGVLVRRGDASQRNVWRAWRCHVSNDPQDWIHRGRRFIQQFS